MTKPLLLIVEDEPDMADFVGEVAKSVGFDTLITTSGIEFQGIYTQNQPSGIVIDIVMPDMDGIELIKWLSANQCSVPIIFMSGYDELYIQIANQIGIEKGCQIVGALTKPFTREELESKFQQISIIN